MKQLLALLAVSASMFAAPSHAAVVYTSAADFLPQVAAGAYTETFSSPDFSIPPTMNFAGGAYSYSASAPDGVWLSGSFLGTYRSTNALAITFTGATVTAIGGNFFNSSNADEFLSTMITIALSDGTSTSLSPLSLADSYRGFTSLVGIASITLTAATGLNFASVDNLTIGTAIDELPVDVPEPASIALLGAGLLGVGALRRRRQS